MAGILTGKTKNLPLTTLSTKTDFPYLSTRFSLFFLETYLSVRKVCLWNRINYLLLETICDWKFSSICSLFSSTK
jgi:hypothetical protein